MNQVIKNGDNVDFKVDAGQTWRIYLTWTENDGTPIDLNGYLGRMYLKRNYNSVAALMITTSNYMTLGTGFVQWEIPKEVTTDLSGEYIYDLELESFNGESSRLFQGSVVISPEVSR